MTDRVSSGPVPHVQLVEEIDPNEWERLLGTFALCLDDDGEEPYVEPGVTEEEAQAIDGVWFGDPDEEIEPDIAAEISANEAAWERAASVAEARIRADPHRRLPIDDAIALARTLGQQVTVWLHHEPWDASDPPQADAERVWPPEGAALRPRWHYEPADAPSASTWSVDFALSGPGITEAIALDAARREPNVLEASVVAVDTAGDGTDSVTVRCLLAHSDEVPATEGHEMLEALAELLGNPEGSLGVGATWPEPVDA